MWRNAIASILLLTSVAAAAEEVKPFSVFARSPRYSMNVDVTPLAEGAYNYNITIVDLATNTVITQPQLTVASASQRAVCRKDVGELRFLISVTQLQDMLSASVDVTRGEDMVIDSIMTRSSIAPHARQVGVVGGVVGGVIGERAAPRPLPPGVYRVGGDVRAPRVIRRVEPMYSAEARRAQISGVVILETIIDKNGFVRDVQVLKPLPYGLDQAAVDAVKQWMFEPGMRNGEPVDVAFNLTVNFKLNAPPPPAPPQ